MHPFHPMVVHFPIALLSTSVFFDVLAARWRPDECRIISLYTLAAGMAGAAVAVISGHLAEEAVENSGLPERVLDLHEGLGVATFWVFAALLGLRLATRLGLLRERRGLSIAVGLAGSVVLLIASYFGGSLVYDYGIGVRPLAK
jgi:uncharacterized membrane protein